jgi:general secretion pathway protein A
MSVYKAFFGLSRDPFSLTPEPDFLYLSPAHEEALSGLAHAMESRKGFVVLTGEVGTGKTSLLNRLVQTLPANEVLFCYLVYPAVAPGDFLEMMLLGFGAREFPAGKPQRLVKFRELLEDNYASGRRVVLVVDEAQKLEVESFEEIRLLSNFEGSGGRLLQVLLSGQVELTTILNRFDLRQLKQRIEVRLSLRALTARETALYMRHRWRVAEALKPFPFEDEAVRRIIDASQGIPRLINVLCDSTLLLAFADNSLSVSPMHVTEATSDLWIVGRHMGPEELAPAAECTDVPGSEAAADSGRAVRHRQDSEVPPKLPTLLRYMPVQSKVGRIGRWLHAGGSVHSAASKG